MLRGMPKTVCIIGAGPGGLVAAKTFLETGRFNVTVYEKSSALGGLWRFDRPATTTYPRGNEYLAATTPTNLSRYTVGFSDLAWESIPLRDEKLRMFPLAAQVGEYLREYARRYVSLPIEFGRRVVEARFEAGKWLVTTTPTLPLANFGENGVKESHDRITAEAPHTERAFDYLINAAGFYDRPCTLDVPISASTPVRAVHSSQFKTLDDLFPDPSLDVRNTTILVLGGGNSGGEAAASVALQLSTALHSLDRAQSTRFEGVHIKHLITRPFHAIPPYIPASTAPTFTPLDLQLYNLRWRPADQDITSQSGRLPPGPTQLRHQAMQNMTGGQADLNAPALLYAKKDECEVAPYGALTEAYAEFVRAKLIHPEQARLKVVQSEDAGEGDKVDDGQNASGKQWPTAHSTRPDGSAVTHPRISAILYATGYNSAAGLSFLSDDIKKKLEFNPDASRLPILLQHWQTHNPAVPHLGFIGFYEGPYWGMMEMQARMLCSWWSTESISQSRSVPELPRFEPSTTHGSESTTEANSKANPAYQLPPISPGESLSSLRDLRAGMLARDRDVPQYWFSDYAGYMEEMSRTLGLSRNDTPFQSPRDGVVTPARYLQNVQLANESGSDSTSSSKSNIPKISREPLGDLSREKFKEASKTMHSLSKALEAVASGRYRARVIFRALQGRWSIERHLLSQRRDMPSGVFEGVAWFHPRQVTDDEYDCEYLYIEQGTFRPILGSGSSTGGVGPVMQATRRYVYRYSEATDAISVWFVRVDEERAADYLFHALELSAVRGSEGGGEAKTEDGADSKEDNTSPTSTHSAFVAGTAAPSDVVVASSADAAASDAATTVFGTASHLCDADFYATTYAFPLAGIRLPAFRVEHTVRGPAKDYVGRATYRR